MSSRTQISKAHVPAACDASPPCGKQRNDTRSQAFHNLVNRTDVRFRSDSWLISNANCAIRSGLEGSDRLHWEMLALWIFVVFSFAALVLAGYLVWAKCADPSPT